MTTKPVFTSSQASLMLGKFLKYSSGFEGGVICLLPLASDAVADGGGAGNRLGIVSSMIAFTDHFLRSRRSRPPQRVKDYVNGSHCNFGQAGFRDAGDAP